jgi:hypothetical protein
MRVALGENFKSSFNIEVDADEVCASRLALHAKRVGAPGLDALFDVGVAELLA